MAVQNSSGFWIVKVFSIIKQTIITKCSNSHFICQRSLKLEREVEFILSDDGKPYCTRNELFVKSHLNCFQSIYTWGDSLTKVVGVFDGGF